MSVPHHMTTVGLTHCRMNWWVGESRGDAVNCTRGEDQAQCFLCLWAGLGGRVFSFILNLKGLLHNPIWDEQIKKYLCSCEHRHVDFFHDYCHWRNISTSFDYRYYLKIIYISEEIIEKVSFKIKLFLRLLYGHLHNAWTS